MLYIPSPFKPCIECRQYFPTTPEYFYSGYARCKNCVKRLLREKYARDPEPMKLYQKQYAAKHPDKILNRKRTYYLEHKTEILIKGKERYQANPDINRRAKRKYSRTDKGRHTIKNGKHKRRAAEGQFTRDDICRQYKKQHGRCFWCSRHSGEHYHIDHIIPTSRYGTNWIANIVISCHSCNESKCDKLPFQEWQPPQCLGR